MTPLKQCIGIDISSKDFSACLCTRYSDDHLRYSKVEKFANTKKGFGQLLKWSKKTLEKEVPVVFLMEATGVYYEQLAHHLSSIKKKVHVVLPNKSKHYFNSLNIKSKTDQIDAQLLSRFGVERKHDFWSAPSKEVLELRNLTRFIVQLNEQKTAFSNFLSSKQAAHYVQEEILKSNQNIIDQLTEQIKQMTARIKGVINSNDQLKTKVSYLLSIPGVGWSTAASILAETQGFREFTSIKQLISFAGLDVVYKESGNYKGKTKISKKGNKYIRRALYFPAITSISHNPDYALFYNRIIQRKPSKKVGVVALQRKILGLMYTLWKKEEDFNPHHKNCPNQKIEATLDSSQSELL